MTKTRVINEEKMLSTMFVKLEYAESFNEFVTSLNHEEFAALSWEVYNRDDHASSVRRKPA